jgi:hypothetical protein
MSNEKSFVNQLSSLSRNKKILVVLSVCLVASLCSYVVASTVSSLNSNTTVPPGRPLPTVAPTPSPSPTPTPTNSFTVTATLNGVAVADPQNIVIPEGAEIGTLYTEVFKITSTANQPISVAVSCPEGVTGNAVIVWDSTTVANAYSVSLPSNGATATMTMYVTLGSVGGNIPLVFTATP